MSREIYRQLQQRLDQYSMGFPATESGIELEILQHLFSEEDALLFLDMTHNLESPEAAAERLGRSVETLAAPLDRMAERGLLFRQKKGSSARYAAIPFVHGLFEFQVRDLDRTLSEMVERYFDEAFSTAMQEGADYFLRPIPVQGSIDAAQAVVPYEDAMEILRSKPRIVVTDCICRKRTGILEKGCEKPLEACFMFGSMGQYYLDRNLGREVSLDEAIDILNRCQEAGLVTQPATSQNPAGMCNCCGDCCGVLTALNKHPRPAEVVFSNRCAEVDREACTGCEDCLDRCQMQALDMDGDGLAVVNPDRCIGCGLCVTSCPADAMRLPLKPEEKRRVPPESMAEQMMLMAQKRGVI